MNSLRYLKLSFFENMELDIQKLNAAFKQLKNLENIEIKVNANLALKYGSLIEFPENLSIF